MTKVALPGSQVLMLPKKKKKKKKNFFFFLFTKPFGMGVTQPTYASYLRKPTHTHTHTHVLPRTQVVPAHARALAVAG